MVLLMYASQHLECDECSVTPWGTGKWAELEGRARKKPERQRRGPPERQNKTHERSSEDQASPSLIHVHVGRKTEKGLGGGGVGGGKTDGRAGEKGRGRERRWGREPMWGEEDSDQRMGEGQRGGKGKVRTSNRIRGREEKSRAGYPAPST